METAIWILSSIVFLFLCGAISRSFKEYKIGKIVTKRQSTYYAEGFFGIEMPTGVIEVRVSKETYMYYNIGDKFAINTY